MSSTIEKVRAILAEQLDVELDSIGEDTDITEDLNADSLDIIELMMALEEEFGLSIDEDEVIKFRTVGDVSRYIDENVQ